MNIQIFLVPYDTALRGWRSGAGPEALIAAGLPAHLTGLGHLVSGIEIIEDDPAQSPAEIRTAFELMRRLASAMRRARDGGHFPLVLSGNCGIAAIAALSALAPAPRSIWWFDAHGEANTPETSSSGFLDGMGLSIAWGWCWKQLASTVPGFRPVAAEASVLIGARDFDVLEEELISKSKVTRVGVKEIGTRLPVCLARPTVKGTLGYLHVDFDVLDPESAGRANSHPAPKGLTSEALNQAIGAIRTQISLGAISLASYAPEYDVDGRVRQAAFAALAAALPPS